MPRRLADARDFFELQEACRFGGDVDRLRAVLTRCRFDQAELSQALLTLRAGRSPVVREDVSTTCEKLLERRIANLIAKQSGSQA